MKAKSEFIPTPRPPLAKKHLDPEYTPEQKEESQMLLRRNSIQNLFNGYEFDIEQLRHQIMQEERKQEVEEENKNMRRMLTQGNNNTTTMAGMELQE